MTSLSVVMPVRDEAQHLPATIEALVVAVERSDFDAELVLVDDGSADGSAEVARRTLAGRLPFSLVRQGHRGRFEARRAGLEAASGDWVLLLDARVRLRAESLAFVAARIGDTEHVWNGHVHVDADGNPYATFWNVLVEIAWRTYFANPTETSYGADDFDHYPKGTGCIVAPRTLLVAAMAASESRIKDPRLLNDDTQLRWIAERERIHLSPAFACDYQARTTLRAFLVNSLSRGSTFVDGHGRRESRFFPIVVAFFPVSAALAVAATRRRSIAPAALALSGFAAGAVAAGYGRRSDEVAVMTLLTPLFVVGYGLGMWRGLARLLVDSLA